MALIDQLPPFPPPFVLPRGSAWVDSWTTALGVLTGNLNACLPKRIPKADLAVPVPSRGKPSFLASGFWLARIWTQRRKGGSIALRVGGWRCPLPLWFLCGDHLVMVSLSLTVSFAFWICSSVSVSILFCILRSWDSFFSLPYTSRLCFAILQGFPREGPHFGRYSLPSDDASSASWARLMSSRMSGSLWGDIWFSSHLLCRSIGCPWSSSLSMSVSLSVVLFSCLIVALCFILKKKRTALSQKLTCCFCYGSAAPAAPLNCITAAQSHTLK